MVWFTPSLLYQHHIGIVLAVKCFPPEPAACLQHASLLQEYGHYAGDDLWGYDDYYDEYYDYYDDVDTAKDCTVDKDGKVKLVNGTGTCSSSSSMAVSHKGPLIRLLVVCCPVQWWQQRQPAGQQ
jgi:hypothetical protein